MDPPSGMKNFWIKQPCYSTYLKTQGLKTAHGEQHYSGFQVNMVEKGREALINIILLTSDTGSLLVCSEETWKKKRKKAEVIFTSSLPRENRKTAHDPDLKRFYSKMLISQQRAHMHFQSQHSSRAARTASTSLPCWVFTFLWPCSKAE